MDALSGRLTRAFAALSGDREAGSVWVARDVPAQRVPVPDGAVHAPASELSRRHRRDGPPCVLVVHRIPPSLLRRIRAAPPDLTVVTGPQLPDLPASAGVLGPGAAIERGRGRTLLSVLSEAELGELSAAVGPARLGWALAPTPRWLPNLLASLVPGPDRAVVEFDATVPWGGADAPTPDDAAWAAAWLAAADTWGARAVWVPAGLAPEGPGGDRPLPWLTAALSGTLERWTGPVFPWPAVLAMLAQAGEEPSDRDRGDLPAAIHRQAARALPSVGLLPGRSAPDGAAHPAAPAASFLAQHVRLRMRLRAQQIAAAGGTPPPLPEDLARAHDVLRQAAAVLTEHESKVVLKDAGIVVTRQAVAESASAAVAFADRIGFPVALKVVSPDLRRKQEVGGVALGVTSGAEVRRTFAALHRAVAKAAPQARVDGILVSEMVPPGVDVQVVVRRFAVGPACLRARVTGPCESPAPTCAYLPRTWPDALLLASAILEPLAGRTRRADDPSYEELARVIFALSRLLEATGNRILALQLDPLRICGKGRPPVVLDARIRQRAHLEGS